MKDKFCVSKSLTYLVALVVAVVGAYYVMNYVNKTSVSTDTEAGSKCRTKTGVTGFWRKSACPAGYTQYGTPGDSLGGTYNYTVAGTTKTMYCCLANFANDDERNPGGTNFGTQDEINAAVTAADCTNKANEIKEMKGLRCMYYTGRYTVSKGKVTCDVKPNDDFIACSPGVGKKLKNKVDSLKSTCNALRGTVVSGSVELGDSTKHYVCRVYTGGYRTGRNPTADEQAKMLATPPDYSGFCFTDYARDYNVGTVASPTYNTNNCH